MRFNDDYDEGNRGRTIIVAAVLCFAAIIVILMLVFFMNYDVIKRKLNKNAGSSSASGAVSTSSICEATYSSDTNVRVEDLEFYKRYPAVSESTSTGEDVVAPIEKEPEVLDETTDGKHTLVKDLDGTEEWVAINPYLTKHTYDFLNLINSNGKMKYYVDNKCVSYLGVDISKDQDYIDFVKLKKAGVDYVMIRVGARGYQTGTISEDEYFADNIKRATDAGLEVGVYFMSQAITEDEAKEEAYFVLQKISGYTLKYPIVFMMQYHATEKARVEALSKNEKTKVAKAFMDTVKAQGFVPMLYGSKAWLIKYVDLSKIISDYDIWLSETDSDSPTFPYKFAMWQYNNLGTVDGIAGYVHMNVSFIDYSLK